LVTGRGIIVMNHDDRRIGGMMRFGDVRLKYRMAVLAGMVSVAFLMSGCSMVMRSVTTDLSDDLSRAVMNNNDLATVETGGAAFLLLVDGLLEGDPESRPLLLTAADLYSQYATNFASEPLQALNLSQKALDYARRAFCLRVRGDCRLDALDFQEFEALLDTMGPKDVPVLYTLGAAWTSWIQVRRADWEAVADLPRARALMERVVDLEEAYEDGGAHMYLGVFATLVPPAAGGKPEEGRTHFERALEISGDKNLMVHVLYAQYYTRMVFDRALHDRLLTRVLSLDPQVPGYVLVNTAAQKQARALLDSSEDYF
jgi:tetratricopeptide (TPR) repeat protein